MAQAEAQALLGVVAPPGQHHFAHPVGADDALDADAGAAADIDATPAFGQLVEGRWLGDPDMAGRGDFEPAANYAALHRGDHRHRAEFQQVERLVPEARMQHAFEGRPVLVFGEVEAGAEVVAGAAHDDRAGFLGIEPVDETADVPDQPVADRVPLLFAVQGQNCDPALPGDGDIVGGVNLFHRAPVRFAWISGIRL